MVRPQQETERRLTGMMKVSDEGTICRGVTALRDSTRKAEAAGDEQQQEAVPTPRLEIVFSGTQGELEPCEEGEL